MSFDAGWLDLREPADERARDRELLAGAAGSATDGVIVDLGCGTGSTWRALSPLLPPTARWRLVDHDPALLAAARDRVPGAETVSMDLSDLDALPLHGASLVTASAFFDLVSAAWIAELAPRLRRAGAALYANLIYDGVMHWDVGHPADAAVTAAFNRHQGGDKGFGPALGPAGAGALRAALQAEGYRVATADSDWLLGPGEAALEQALLEGVAQAAAEAGAEVEDWLSFRLAAAGRAGCRIGHQDLLATP